MHFQDKISCLYFLKHKLLRSESVNYSCETGNRHTVYVTHIIIDCI